jgi:hypothetical protein
LRGKPELGQGQGSSNPTHCEREGTGHFEIQENPGRKRRHLRAIREVIPEKARLFWNPIETGWKEISEPHNF